MKEDRIPTYPLTLVNKGKIKIKRLYVDLELNKVINLEKFLEKKLNSELRVNPDIYGYSKENFDNSKWDKFYDRVEETLKPKLKNESIRWGLSVNRKSIFQLNISTKGHVTIQLNPSLFLKYIDKRAKIIAKTDLYKYFLVQQENLAFILNISNIKLINAVANKEISKKIKVLKELHKDKTAINRILDNFILCIESLSKDKLVLTNKKTTPYIFLYFSALVLKNKIKQNVTYFRIKETFTYLREYFDFVLLYVFSLAVARVISESPDYKNQNYAYTIFFILYLNNNFSDIRDTHKQDIHKHVSIEKWIECTYYKFQNDVNFKKLAKFKFRNYSELINRSLSFLKKNPLERLDVGKGSIFDFVKHIKKDKDYKKIFYSKEIIQLETLSKKYKKMYDLLNKAIHSNILEEYPSLLGMKVIKYYLDDYLDLIEKILKIFLINNK